MPSSTRTMHGVAFTRDDYQDWRAQVNGHEIVLRKCTNGGGAGTMWAAIIDPAKNVPGPARDGKLIGSWPKLSKAASRAIVTAEEDAHLP